jgi:FecR-like protein
LPGADIVTPSRFSFAVSLLGFVMLAGAAGARPAPMEPTPEAPSAARAATKLAQAQPAPATAAAPTADATASDEPIGNVATLTGSATVTRNNAAAPLQLKDDIYLNDVLQTAANSTLGVTFNDATTFNLTANAKITVDSFVYEDGGKANNALFDIAKGTVAFAAAAVAKTGDMTISTPTATLGIRGTTGLVEVPEGAVANNPNNVAIKLYPDADGRVGRIEVNDRTGARLGFLTQGASGFTIRPGAGGRFTAAALTISPQQALRDQGVVRQVHAAQTVGRQVVTEQRALRRANPNNPNRANPRQPGLQRPNGLPGQNRPGLQQPGAPNRQGLQQRPGAPATPGARAAPGTPATPGAPTTPGTPAAPQRAGQPPLPGTPAAPGAVTAPRAPGQPGTPATPAQPGQPNRPGVQPPPGVQQGAPGVQRPGLQNRPALQPRRPAPAPAPRGKKGKR